MKKSRREWEEPLVYADASQKLLARRPLLRTGLRERDSHHHWYELGLEANVSIALTDTHAHTYLIEGGVS